MRSMSKLGQPLGPVSDDKLLPKLAYPLKGQKNFMEGNMIRKTGAFATLIALALFSGFILAQDPVVNIDRNRHPNLAEAQEHLVAANAAIARAQADNHYDMKGHAEKARQHIAEADRELRAAATAANEGMRR